MEKLDLTKAYKAYYTATNQPELINIPAASFLSIEGIGDPSGQQYADKLQALYSVAYAIKFAFKALGKDFTVAKLEGLWSFDESKYPQLSMAEASVKVPRAEWRYRTMIRMPEFVTATQVDIAIRQVLDKKQISLVKEITFFQMTEGKSVQMLHTGPFANEPETLQKMMEFIQLHKLERNGLHHEIYLSDFRKTAPEKLRTILREPVK
ncbi:GyrI-like domain-containing protein [Pedobacter sp. FW305-3-2-15-E-R2A2]|uniref:GyrI-like domain-containing protein n=1 Tax=Pedobacter sp. FW305-3-2-15-E-R2A2 TaxID=3140251 RepID=UPI00313FF789